MAIVEKHLKNVKPITDFEEAQILVEILTVVIFEAYLKELDKDLPKIQSIERWPDNNSLTIGFDFAKPKGRKVVLKTLIKN
ncbi:hypothetical protein Glove_245g14 [Diversispora epigaea]|uniref:Uncharacterized protein n=1 Tax=Diversispora epigaea TaxID=1348612 RepID=A0A397I8N0_9GLOM|nr:hypothetical protein Glove_245g14 [Diversispora epigaea]